MKVIIAGGRDVDDLTLLEQEIANSGFTITEVVSGGCSGADTLGEQWARRHRITLRRFPANWDDFGPKAGPLRNQAMAAYADALILLNSGGKGSKNMLREAKVQKMKIHAIKCEKTPEGRWTKTS